jgi:hypothetical protein
MTPHRIFRVRRTIHDTVWISAIDHRAAEELACHDAIPGEDAEVVDCEALDEGPDEPPEP